MAIETGIYFDDVHSFYDLDLILSGLEIPPAKPKTTYVDVPGGDGSVDLTEANGEVKFYDRACKFTFTMNPMRDLSEAAWEAKKTEVSNRLNGKVCNITLDKDCEFYYTGRCTVDSYLSDKRLRQIIVTAKVKPYKFKQYETAATFELSKMEQTVSISNLRKSVCPLIDCTDNDTKITFGAATFTVAAGTHQFMDIRFVEGDNQLTLSGTGSITFRFREGDL